MIPTDAEIAMSPKLAVRSPGANDVSCFAVPRQFTSCLASNAIGATLAGSFDKAHFEFQNALFPALSRPLAKQCVLTSTKDHHPCDRMPVPRRGDDVRGGAAVPQEYA